MTTCKMRYVSGCPVYTVNGQEVERDEWLRACEREHKEVMATREKQNGKRYVAPPVTNPGDGWKYENGGKGHPCRSLARYPGDPQMYCNDRSEMIEKTKRNEQKFYRD